MKEEGDLYFLRLHKRQALPHYASVVNFRTVREVLILVFTHAASLITPYLYHTLNDVNGRHHVSRA